MTHSPHTIVAATSLQEASDLVVHTAAEIARRSGASLYLVHAHQSPLASLEAFSRWTNLTSQSSNAEDQVRRQLLEEQLARVGVDPSLVTDITICEGNAHTKILETAEMLNSDLIVMGALENPNFRFLGSTTDRVLRQAHCPVWVTSGTPTAVPSQILAPIDFSDISGECLAEGLRLVALLNADAAFVVETFFVITINEVLRADPGILENLEKAALEELEKFTLALEIPNSARLLCRVRGGEIRTEIMREVETEEPDLVIVGTHGRSGCERYLLGSVASDVAGRSPVSVLVVPPSPERCAAERLARPVEDAAAETGSELVA